MRWRKNEMAISTDRLLSDATRLFFQSSCSSPIPARSLINPALALDNSSRRMGSSRVSRNSSELDHWRFEYATMPHIGD
jgi:hypothetical protein